jgi:ribonucleoside-diphosphate reductase alpha chain
MVAGFPYDSPDSRAIVAAMTAILTGKVYATSALLARRFGPFDGFAADRENMLAVMEKHREHAYRIDDSTYDDCSPAAAADPGLFRAARESWDEVLDLGRRYGYRNSQATCIAPTGTIAFMMGCDTLGIEPEIALVRFKALAGRGTLKLVNRSVRLALENLGYPGGLIDSIMNHISRYNTIEDVVSNGGHAVAPSGLRSGHLPIFDCAFPPSPVAVDGYEWRPAWGRSIGIDGHVDMMAAATPLVSGAVSKTVNMSISSTVDDILRVYGDAWRKGCKAIAVYRDGSKGSQPVTTSEVSEMKAEADSRTQADEKAMARMKEVICKMERESDIDKTIIEDLHGQVRVLAETLAKRETELRAIRRNDGPQPFPDGPRPQADEKVIRRLKEVNAKLESEIGMLRGWGDGASETAIREIDGLRALKNTMQAANVRMHDELAARNRDVANLRAALGSAAPEPRFRMPIDRHAKIHKFNVSGHEGFIIRGMTESGELGEVFIEMSKQGSTVAGLMDCVGILISLALQHRVPVAKVVEKMEFQKFNPAGITTNRDIKFCSSIIDYVGRFLGIHHVPGYRERMRPVRSDGATPAEPMGVGAVDDVPATYMAEAGKLISEMTALQDYIVINDVAGGGLKALIAEGIKSTSMIPEDINNDPCPSCGSIMVRVQPNCMVCYGCGYVDGGCGG